MKIFYLDKSLFLVLILVIICGLFNNFVIYFSIIIVHELGHALTGIILKNKLDKIKLYSYGGETVFKCNYNYPIKKELIILIMGPLVQIIYYIILKNFIHYEYLKVYHYTLLFFNLLPIYPLDGGRILNIIFNFHYNYKRSFKISIMISFIFIIMLVIYNIKIFNFNYLLISVVLLTKLFKLYKDFPYTYNNFLLDRLLYNYQFKETNCINSYDKFYKDKSHIINMMPEKKFLYNYFKK